MFSNIVLPACNKAKIQRKKPVMPVWQNGQKICPTLFPFFDREG